MKAHFKSLSHKFRSLMKNGLTKTMAAQRMGEYYLKHYDREIEELAKERFERCKSLMIDEPIEWLKVKDSIHPEWSGKIFKDCGCPVSVKLRQTIIDCKCWE